MIGWWGLAQVRQKWPETTVRDMVVVVVEEEEEEEQEEGC